MEIFQSDKFFIFILFVIPGFIGMKFYEIIYSSGTSNASSKLIDVVSYSCLNYAVLSPLLYWMYIANVFDLNRILFSFLIVFILFISPIIGVLVTRKIRSSKFALKIMPHPIKNAWEFVFSQKKPYWVIVTLKSGVKLAGLYGENSFSTCGDVNEQIYLEQSWEVNDDGGFERMRNDSSGVLILSKEIDNLEFFHFNEVGNDE